MSYKVSAENKLKLLEFFHCYFAMRLVQTTDSFMIGFSTIKPDELPIDCDSLEVIRKDVDKKFDISLGWMEMGNYYLMGKNSAQMELVLNFVIEVSDSQLSGVQAYLAKVANILSQAKKIYDWSNKEDGVQPHSPPSQN